MNIIWMRRDRPQMVVQKYCGRQPGKVSGAWVLKNTRMPVAAIFENLEAGASLDNIMEWFEGLNREHVKAVIEFAARSLDTPAPGCRCVCSSIRPPLFPSARFSSLSHERPSPVGTATRIGHITVELANRWRYSRGLTPRCRSNARRIPSAVV